MTQERRDGPTPRGGDYAVAVYVRLETLEEVDQRVADGVVVTEFTDDGRVVNESVMTYTADPSAAQPETVEDHFARLGVKLNPPTGKTTVVFLGSRAARVFGKLI